MFYQTEIPFPVQQENWTHKDDKSWGHKSLVPFPVSFSYVEMHNIKRNLDLVVLNFIQNQFFMLLNVEQDMEFQFGSTLAIRRM